MAVTPPGNYCGINETPLPDDQSFKIDVDIQTSLLNSGFVPPYSIPTQIDGAGSLFGLVPAALPLYDETFDGFEAALICMPSAVGSSSFSQPCPVIAQGLLVFEALHLAFRAASVFKTEWSEVPECDYMTEPIEDDD